MLKDSKGKKVFAKTRDIVKDGPACRVSTQFSLTTSRSGQIDASSLSTDLRLDGCQESDWKLAYRKLRTLVDEENELTIRFIRLPSVMAI